MRYHYVLRMVQQDYDAAKFHSRAFIRAELPYLPSTMLYTYYSGIAYHICVRIRDGLRRARRLSSVWYAPRITQLGAVAEAKARAELRLQARTALISVGRPACVAAATPRQAAPSAA